MPVSCANGSVTILAFFMASFSIFLVFNVFTADVVVFRDSQQLPVVAAGGGGGGGAGGGKVPVQSPHNWTAFKNYLIDESQTQRLGLLRQKCDEYFPTDDRLTKASNLKPKQQMIANHYLKYLACLVPKVASTSFKRLLSLAVGAKKDPGFGIHIPRVFRPYFSAFASFPVDEKREIVKSHFKFTIVRHPFERLVSAYVDRFLEVALTKYQDVHLRMADVIRHQYRSDGSTTNITFAELVRHIIDENRQGKQLDNHWRPYNELCQPCLIQYDFIGHYETLREDTRYVLRKLNIDKLVQLPPDTRPYHKSADRVRKYFSQLSPDHVRQLQQIYRLDFELFGYDYRV